MEAKYYVAMAHTVAGYKQSDELFLMKLADGRIIGYASEFNCWTSDIGEACREQTHQFAKWQPMSQIETTGWMPATLDEIRALDLENCLIGSTRALDADAPMQPV
jgi:hypothetical protein